MNNLQTGGIKLDLASRQMDGPAGTFQLTKTEARLLAQLMKNYGQAVSRPQLLADVWGYDWFGDKRTLEVYICWLRKKLGESGKAPKKLTTIRGYGYRLG